MGQWIGRGKFVFSSEEKAQYKQDNNDKWHSKWITVFRLKKDRLWTDKIIKDFLGKPITQGKYKVFKKEDVKQAEKKKAFKKIMIKRIEKIKLKDEYFISPEKL
jgi:predicted RNA-binding protein YlxR (DUF448 family)